jgi:hypothetical protein
MTEATIPKGLVDLSEIREIARMYFHGALRPNGDVFRAFSATTWSVEAISVVGIVPLRLRPEIAMTCSLFSTFSVD